LFDPGLAGLFITSTLLHLGIHQFFIVSTNLLNFLGHFFPFSIIHYNYVIRVWSIIHSAICLWIGWRFNFRIPENIRCAYVSVYLHGKTKGNKTYFKHKKCMISLKQGSLIKENLVASWAKLSTRPGKDKNKKKNTIRQDILASMVKQEKLLFEHNKNRLQFWYIPSSANFFTKAFTGISSMVWIDNYNNISSLYSPLFSILLSYFMVFM